MVFEAWGLCWCVVVRRQFLPDLQVVAGVREPGLLPVGGWDGICSSFVFFSHLSHRLCLLFQLPGALEGGEACWVETSTGVRGAGRDRTCGS